MANTLMSSDIRRDTLPPLLCWTFSTVSLTSGKCSNGYWTHEQALAQTKHYCNTTTTLMQHCYNTTATLIQHYTSALHATPYCNIFISISQILDANLLKALPLEVCLCPLIELKIAPNNLEEPLQVCERGCEVILRYLKAQYHSKKVGVLDVLNCLLWA